MTEETGSLDAAWREAEEALPEGWWIDGIERCPERLDWEWTAWADSDEEPGPLGADGPTPAAALRSLAATLRLPKDDDTQRFKRQLKEEIAKAEKKLAADLDLPDNLEVKFSDSDDETQGPWRKGDRL